MVEQLKRLGLAQLVRGLVVGSIPPLWAEIVILHFRGNFHLPYMWIPVLSLPVIFGVGLRNVLRGDSAHSRATFRPWAWLMAAAGALAPFSTCAASAGRWAACTTGALTS